MKDDQMRQQINELYHISKPSLAWVHFLNAECRDTILRGMGELEPRPRLIAQLIDIVVIDVVETYVNANHS